MTSVIRELKLHSPAGVEPAIFTWPSVERQVSIFFVFDLFLIYTF